MNAPNPAFSIPPATGAAMDRVVKRDPRKHWIKIGATSMAVLLLAGFGWSALPKGYAVKTSDLELATVSSGTFLDALVQRSSVVPLSSVYLDATEGGRVEEVTIHDGAMVKKGDLLFRLSNPQRQQDVLARSSEVAQQLANLENLRATLAGSRASFRREIAGLEFDLDQVSKTYQRNVQLAAKGFLSAAALQESADKVAQQKRLLQETRADGQAELDTREQSLKELEGAIAGLNNGLRLVRAAENRLQVRAPVDGRLTGFQLQVGESVKPADRLGRVDSPDRFKLSANVDEFYLSRVSPGLHASALIESKPYALSVSRLNPQVKDGRFTIELTFDGVMPTGLQPGESVDAQITLGQPSQALLLNDGSFYTDSGGSWVFVLDADGKHAKRRNVHLGRRAAGKIEVLGGLQAGDRVVVSSYRRFGDVQTLRLES